MGMRVSMVSMVSMVSIVSIVSIVSLVHDWCHGSGHLQSVLGVCYIFFYTSMSTAL